SMRDKFRPARKRRRRISAIGVLAASKMFGPAEKSPSNRVPEEPSPSGKSVQSLSACPLFWAWIGWTEACTEYTTHTHTRLASSSLSTSFRRNSVLTSQIVAFRASRVRVPHGWSHSAHIQALQRVNLVRIQAAGHPRPGHVDI